jgi:hypothetical protein
MSASTTPPGEGATGEQGRRLGDEMRLLLDVLAERAQPWLQQIATPRQAGDGEHQPTTCDWCPVCAAVAMARGEHSELAARAAEHVLGLLALVRAGLATHDHHAGHHQHRHSAEAAGRTAADAAEAAARAAAEAAARAAAEEAAGRAESGHAAAGRADADDHVSATGPAERAEGHPPGQPGDLPTAEEARSTGSAADDAERASRVQRIAVHRRTGAGAGSAAGAATAAPQGTGGAASSAAAAKRLARSGAGSSSSAGAAGSEAEC